MILSVVPNGVIMPITYQEDDKMVTDIFEFDVYIVNKLIKKDAKKNVLYMQTPSIDKLEKEGKVYIYMNKTFLPINHLNTEIIKRRIISKLPSNT